MDKIQLIKIANQARKNAYTPYSKFKVGAALLCEDGSVVTGCNVENSSYPAGCCAERTAIFKAISEGRKNFRALAIMGGPAEGEVEDFCSPCGICRQVLSEFVEGDFPLYTENGKGEIKEYTMQELLPYAFSEKNLFPF